MNGTVKYTYTGIRFLFVGLVSVDGQTLFLMDSDPWTKTGTVRKQTFYARFIARPVLRLFKLEKMELMLVQTSEDCRNLSESKLRLVVQASKDQKN